MPALVTLVAVAVFSASCGGSTFPSAKGPSSTTTAALTTAEYVARANAVCATGNARSDGIGDPGSDLNKQAEVVDAGAVIATDTLRQLRRLPVPDGDAASVATIYANYDKLIKDAARMSAALRAGDLVTAQRVEQDVQGDESAADAAANAYGLTVCGSNSGSDVPSSPTATSVPASPASGTPCVADFPCGSGTSSISAPSSVAASVATTPVGLEVTITFQSPAGYLGWNVYRGDDHTPFEQAHLCSCAGSEGRAFDPDVVAGHQYTYYVVATNQYRTAFSHPASITVDVPNAPSVPASSQITTPCDDMLPCGSGTSSIPAPSSVAASVAIHGQLLGVTITWQPPAGYLGWNVYRGDDHTPFEQSHLCSCAGSPGRAIDNDDVVAGHRYTYYVVALSQDRTTFSHPASITVDVPLRP